MLHLIAFDEKAEALLFMLEIYLQNAEIPILWGLENMRGIKGYFGFKLESSSANQISVFIYLHPFIDYSFIL